MQGKKELLAQSLHVSGMLRAFRPGVRKRLLVLNYHRILSNGGKRHTDFDDRLSGVTEAQFEQQISWLSRNTELLSEQQLLNRLEGHRHGRLPAAVVTFDDGYRDNYTLAFPLLRKYRIPAFFFVCSDLINERKLGWWDLISYFLKRTRKLSIDLDGNRFALPQECHIAERHYKTRMKLEPHASTRDLVTKLSEACEVPPPPAEEQDRELMTWDQLREVSRQGITVGSHTHSHTVLATLDVAKQKQELSLSKRVIEQQVGLPVRCLAYPVGGAEHFSIDTKNIAQQCGYAAAFSYGTGLNRWGRIEPYNIRRISIEGSGVQIAATMALPSLFL